jgi:DNA-binding response OmpR family regulator
MPLGRVLVVDDEPEVGAMLRDALVEFGYVVKNARSGPEALGLMNAFAPDVVLLDVMMPGMSGDEVLSRLRRGHPQVAVVMVTAQQDEEAGRQLLAQGAVDYVQKPCDLDVLERIVGAAVALRRP